MQITFTPLINIVIIGILCLAIPSAAEGLETFRLRAWRHYRYPPPALSHYIEVASNGDAIVNKTAGYPGFESYFKPTPEGRSLHKLDNGYHGYLLPLHDVTTNPPSTNPHYQLRYSKSIPRNSGVLYTNFTSVWRHCAGNCITHALDYGLGGAQEYHGQWYVIQEKDKACTKAKKGKNCDGNVWKVRWIGFKNQEPLVYPEGALGGVFVSR